MKPTRCLAALALTLPLIAQAHPGHDGDHDLVWDYGHLVANPLATLLCVGLLAASFWSVRQFLKARRPQAEARPRR